MTPGAWISLISLLAWLVLALSAWRSRQVPLGKTLFMAAMWSGIFVVFTLVFAMAGQQ